VHAEPSYEEELQRADRHKILLTHGHRDRRKDRCGSGPGLVLFRLVVPPLHPGVEGPYLVQSAWFPSHLPLDGAESYLDFSRP
jgi:hypothetical protein